LNSGFCGLKKKPDLPTQVSCSPGGSRRIRNRAGRFVAPPFITNRSLHEVKIPVSSEEKADSRSPTPAPLRRSSSSASAINGARALGKAQLSRKVGCAGWTLAMAAHLAFQCPSQCNKNGGGKTSSDNCTSILRSVTHDLARALIPHTAAAVGVAFTTHAHSAPSRLLLAAKRTLGAG